MTDGSAIIACLAPPPVIVAPPSAMIARPVTNEPAPDAAKTVAPVKPVLDEAFAGPMKSRRFICNSLQSQSKPFRRKGEERHAVFRSRRRGAHGTCDRGQCGSPAQTHRRRESRLPRRFRPSPRIATGSERSGRASNSNERLTFRGDPPKRCELGRGRIRVRLTVGSRTRTLEGGANDPRDAASVVSLANGRVFSRDGAAKDEKPTFSHERRARRRAKRGGRSAG